MTERKFMCVKCGKILENLDAYGMHMRRKHPELTLPFSSDLLESSEDAYAKYGKDAKRKMVEVSKPEETEPEETEPKETEPEQAKPKKEEYPYYCPKCQTKFKKKVKVCSYCGEEFE